MLDKDQLQRFLFETANIRGEMVRLNSTYAAITERHPYPIAVQQFLGQALAATALLSATIKFSGRLTMQIQGDGPVNLLVAQSDEKFHLRGLAKWEKEQEPIANDFTKAFGAGQLAITIAPTKGERYQGIVSLDTKDLATALETYFHQSEQLPTCLCLFADTETAAGILLQAMPCDTSEQRYQFWENIVHLTRTLTTEEALSLSNQTILKRLFAEEDIRLFNAEPIQFRCECSLEKMERALVILGKEEVYDILKTNREVTVTCEFCHNYYHFDKSEADRIFSNQ